MGQGRSQGLPTAVSFLSLAGSHAAEESVQDVSCMAGGGGEGSALEGDFSSPHSGSFSLTSDLILQGCPLRFYSEGIHSRGMVSVSLGCWRVMFDL